MPRPFYVYILASRSRVLYIGVTSNLAQRVQQHKLGLVEGFTARYHVHRLVYYEQIDGAETAIAREKQLKGWLRSRKVDLIESVNPRWDDLAEIGQMPF